MAASSVFAELPEREAELVVDLLELGVPVGFAALQGATRRVGRLRGTVEREQGAAEVLEVAGARVLADRGLERGERLLGPSGVEERQAELVVRERVAGIELQLLAELHDGALAALRARGRVREETHAQVVVRPPHLRVLGEGGAKLGLRPRVLARVTVGAADEDPGLGDGPRGHDPREEALRLARLLEPQVLGGDEEERLGVLARGDARFAERVRGGVELAGGGPGPREQPEGFHVPRRPESGVGQDLEGPGGVARLELERREGDQRLLRVPAEERGLGKPFSRRLRPALQRVERRPQHGALEQYLAIQRLRRGEGSFLEAPFGLGDLPLEGGRRVGGRGRREDRGGERNDADTVSF